MVMIMMNEEGARNVEPCMPCMITWEPSSSLNSLTHYDDHGGCLLGESPVVMIMVILMITKLVALVILIIHIKSKQISRYKTVTILIIIDHANHHLYQPS